MAIIALPVAALTINLASTSIVWIGGDLLGATGGFWRTYWMGLGISAAAALGTALVFDSMEASSAVLILGLPAGNIYGYVTTPPENKAGMAHLRLKLVEFRI